MTKTNWILIGSISAFTFGCGGSGDDPMETAVEAACDDVCRMNDKCFDDAAFTLSGCKAQCEKVHDDGDQTCKADWLDSLDCLSGLTCSGLQEAVEGFDPYPCQREDEASAASCTG